ncbi:membrane protein insertion efficiency factor YidD [Ilumatobacter coccineus]|uniref:Putative membrane protein insertion efficiency factor n=1 Tax=Ilumatobacter coccineus (strain NBRC 103263 / KCTC 29153 / YM16-304) TaxID=1313172 RepID=A0A6C7EED7_ILUCY|nr:hypothetical protein YM304_42890 [Ilumatobacter coccineus YM16-304]
MSSEAAPRSWFQRRALAVIDFYQRAAEGRPSPCRFSPSCSSYAREAFEVHGGRRGSWLTMRRLLRCRPFGPSGWDPVPEPSADPHQMPHTACAAGDHVDDSSTASAVPSTHSPSFRPSFKDS